MSPHWFEDPGPLSESVLWSRNRDFYTQQGTDAWSHRRVPTQVTTNAFVAEAYAGMILDQLRDTPIDPSTPVYIVELGAGSGRLAFHVVHALQRLRLPNSPRVIYVLTDMAGKNVQAWRQHPQLQPLIEAGLADTAMFDCEAPKPIALHASGVVLDRSDNPVVLIANYVLDSLRHELIVCRDGRAQPVHLRAGAHEDGVLALDLHTQSERPEFFDDDAIGPIIDEYARELTHSRVLIPRRAMDMLRWWMRTSGDRLLLLLADKMHRAVPDLDHIHMPHLALHGDDGCVSVVVNAHALTRLFEQRGGVVHHSTSSDQIFTISAFVLSPDPTCLAASARHFARWLDDPGPVDVYRMTQSMLSADRLSATDALLALRASCYDDYTFMRAAKTLPDLVYDAPTDVQKDLVHALALVWRRAFRAGGYPDLAFRLARVYTALSEHAAARHMYLESLRSHGAHPATLYNLAITCEAVGELTEAHHYVAKALELEPDFALGLRWRERHATT